MAEPKQMKLHSLKVMTVSQHVKCQWCEYGRDPGRAGICAACHRQFKLLLSSTMWRRLRSARLSDPATSFCRGFDLVISLDGVAGLTHYDCQQQIPVPAYIIDHIDPWRYKPSLFWEPTNHQSLCLDCNAKKTQMDGSFDHSPRRNQ